MEQSNPYRAPSVDVSSMIDDGTYDQTNPLSPKGRFGRLSYLAWIFLVGIAMYAVMAVLGVAIFGASMFTSGANGVPGAGMALLLPLELVAFVFFALIAIRRLHDCNASGWWLLLIVVPLANVVFGLFLVLKAGSEGGNRFGSPRLTRGWERVLAYINIGFMVLALVGGIVAAVVIPGLAH
ncbi:MAG: DUF805 domain-containing protein [Acidihalobacter sp.]|uniref:DUF805 domain-containing protein n=1 Tax=Acidihalobacter sp. TaxID=1872108 RepID=UPI00307E1EF7